MKKILFVILAVFNMHLAYADNYTVIYKGIKAGDAELTIDTQVDTYRVELGLHPGWLARFALDDMVENAQGIIAEGHFYPNNYRRSDVDGKILLNVNFAGNTASIREDDTQRDLNIDIKGQDPLSQMAQIQYDLRHRQLQKNYYLVTDSGQRLYTSRREGNAIILTEQPSKRRELLLWFDDELKLVKIQKNKAGKTQFYMQRTDQ